MVGSTGALMTMRLVRSKLRKCEEASSSSQTAIEDQQSAAPQNVSNCLDNCETHHQSQHMITTSTIIQCNNNTASEELIFTRTSGSGDGVMKSNSWVFPPKAPTPNIDNCVNIDALQAANDRNSFKGFRKQFSGRFKRLVAKKSEPSPLIPPELKPQLKTIYVY